MSNPVLGETDTLIAAVATAVAAGVGELVKEWIRQGNVQALDALAAVCPSADVIEARALALIRAQDAAAAAATAGRAGGGT